MPNTAEFVQEGPGDSLSGADLPPAEARRSKNLVVRSSTEEGRSC